MSGALFNRHNLALALIEHRARELWGERRPRWDEATPQAREVIGAAAFDQLLSEGAITLDGHGIHAVGGLA